MLFLLIENVVYRHNFINFTRAFRALSCCSTLCGLPIKEHSSFGGQRFSCRYRAFCSAGNRPEMRALPSAFTNFPTLCRQIRAVVADFGWALVTTFKKTGFGWSPVVLLLHRFLPQWHSHLKSHKVYLTHQRALNVSVNADCIVHKVESVCEAKA